MTDKENLLSRDLLVNRVIAMGGNVMPWLRQSEVEYLKMSYEVFKDSYTDPEAVKSVSNLVDLSNKYFDEFTKLKTRSTKDIPKEFIGNYWVYSMLSTLIDDVLAYDYEKGKNYQDKMEIAIQSEISNKIRNLSSVKSYNKSGPVFSTTDHRDYYIRLQTLASELEKVRDDEFFLLGGSLKGYDKAGEVTRRIILNDYYCKSAKIKSKIRVVQLGTALAVRIRNEWFITTAHHYRRLVEIIKTISTIVLMTSSMSINCPIRSFLVSYITVLCRAGMNNPERVGEYLKATRQMFIYDLDASPIMSKSPKSDYLSTLDSDRVKYAKMFYGIVNSLCKDKETAINLCNTYKSFAHPDTDLERVFESIKGFKSPNKLDDSFLPRFKGTLRRSLYRSLSTSGHDIRLSVSEESQEARTLVNDSLAPIVITDKMVSRSSNVWSKVKFRVTDSIPKAEKLRVKAGDKSSQKPGPGSMDELEELIRWSMGELPAKPEYSDNYATVNDTRSVIAKTDNLNPDKAVARFKRIIAAHKKFEEKYYDSAQLTGFDRNIDNIPSEELAKFIYLNKEVRTIVGTEPKLGEYHKEFTRMFYMGEQFIKALTQRVERLARFVSRKQQGVSIVKSYSANQRDIEKFCHAMTGPIADNRAVYVSFDLSEFSKKFPQRLVQAYGEVLYELTGEEWLRRIDVLFRSALVIHNSRGYFNMTTGVLGGFEGFLNFVWSSAHAVIMEIALESLGVKGELLTFSDDGLLYFIAPKSFTDSDVRRLIGKIKEVYAKYGLEFNVKKTFISTIIWEYLGNICFNSHIISSFIKEASTYGKNLRSKGVMTHAAAFDQIIGQTRSLVKSGCSPNIAYFLLRYSSHIRLSRIRDNIPNSVVEAIFITPRNCGGFRLPSTLEMMSSSEINQESEYIADLVIYNKFADKVSRLSANFVLSNMAPKEMAIDALITGSRFKTKGIKTSGIAVMNMILDELKTVTAAKVTKHPLTRSRKVSIQILLKSFYNLNPNILEFFFSSLSEWEEYNNSIALIKSSSARDFLGISRIKHYQKTDSHFVASAISSWIEYSKKPNLPKVDPVKLVHRFSTRFTDGYDLTPLKPSGRIVLIRSSDLETSSILVRSDFSIGSRPSNLAYKEPCSRFTKTYSTLRWMSEDNSINEFSSARKLVDAVASVLSYNPESEDLLYDLSRIFGVELPPIPAGLLDNPERKSVRANKPYDVTVFMPRYFNALSSVRYMNALHGYLYATTGKDRVTYAELARCLACIEYDSLRLKYIKNPVRLTTYQVHRDSLKSMFETPQLRPKPNYEPLSGDLLNTFSYNLMEEFEMSLKEHVEYARHEELFDYSNLRNLDRNSDDFALARHFKREKLLAWVRGIISNSQSMISPSDAVALSMLDRQEDVIYAVELAAYYALDPISRQQVSRILLGRKIQNLKFTPLAREGLVMDIDNITDEGDGFDDEYADYSDEDINYDENLIAMQDAITSYEREYDEFSLMKENEQNDIMVSYFNMANKIAESITSVDRDRFPYEMFDIFTNYDVRSLKYLTTHILNRTLFSNMPTFVTRVPSARPGKFTANYRHLINEVFTNSLTMLYTACYALNWNKNSIRNMLPSLGDVDIDNLLDFLFISRPIIRSSDHRSPYTPFNFTSLLISYRKFDYIVNREVGIELSRRRRERRSGRRIDWRDRSWEDDIDYSIGEDSNDPFTIEMADELVRELTYDSYRTGPDHKRFILDELHKSIQSRIKLRIRYFVRDNLKPPIRPIGIVDRILSTIKINVLHPFIDRIKEIPSEYSDVALGGIKLDAYGDLDEKIPMVKVTNNEDKIIGTNLSPNAIACNEAMVDLLSTMIETFVITNGLPSVRLTDDPSKSDIEIFSSGLHTKSGGMRVSNLSDNYGTLMRRDIGAEVFYSVIRSNTHNTALNNYIILNAKGSLVKVVRESDSFLTVVVGTSEMENEIIEDRSRMTAEDIHISKEFFSNRTLSSERRRLVSMNKAMVAPHSTATYSATNAIPSAYFVRLNWHSFGVATDNVRILAASRIIRDMSTSNAHLAAYMLVKAHLLSGTCENPERAIIDHIKSIIGTKGRRKITESKLHDTMLLEYDIATTVLWLRTAGFPPGDPSLDPDIEKTIDKVRAVFTCSEDRVRPMMICHVTDPIDIHELLNCRIDDPSTLITNMLYPLRSRLLEGGSDSDSYDEYDDYDF